MHHPNKEIMKRLIDLSKEKKVVTAAIVRDEEIIAIGFNTVKQDINPVNHAEINAIRLAAEKIRSWKLEGCYLYSLFEPCPMCASAAVWARIKGIVYGANMNDRNENYTQRILVSCEEILSRGTPKIELHKDFMREECQEVLVLK